MLRKLLCTIALPLVLATAHFKQVVALLMRVKLLKQQCAFYVNEREWDYEAAIQGCDNEAPINLIRINSN